MAWPNFSDPARVEGERSLGFQSKVSQIGRREVVLDKIKVDFSYR
jgi:hypothetical protein